MDFGEIYHFLFETYFGLGLLVGAGLLVTLIASVIMERRTRKRFKHHEKEGDEDSWSFFEDDDEETDTKETSS